MCVLIGWLGLSAVAFGQEADPGFHLVGIGSVSIPVSGMKMTNLVFPAEVSSAVKVSKDVQMQRPKGVQNVIELKALRRDFPPTNLSVYGRDGHPYSFVLHFVDDTSVLNFQVVRGDAITQGSGSSEGPAIIFAGLPVDGVTLDSDGVALSERRPFLHKSVSVSGVRLRLRGIYLRDSLLWLCLGLKNRVQISFIPSYMRVYVEDKKEIKRMASQQAAVVPVYTSPLETVPGHGTGWLAVGIRPLVLPRGKKLKVEMADSGGGRVLILALKGKELLWARKVERSVP